jgi:hypothetical protein
VLNSDIELIDLPYRETGWDDDEDFDDSEASD